MRKSAVVLSLVFLHVFVNGAMGDFLTHVDLNQSTFNFAYTVFNDEPVESSNYISSFHLTVAAPIMVTGSPAGWDFATDNSTYVDWFNTDAELPYANDIPPQGSAMFSIQSVVETTDLLQYTLSAWNHELDEGGPSHVDEILAPSAVIPEPHALALLIMAGVGLLFRRRATIG